MGRERRDCDRHNDNWHNPGSGQHTVIAMMPFYLHHDISGTQQAGTKKGCWFADEAIDVWENEGGLPSESSSPKLEGTELQVKWPEPMEVHTNAHFGVNNGFEPVARKQAATAQINSRAAILSIFEGKPVGVAEDGAGYLIHEWQALRDQARRMII
jgi:hypothetical protein